MLGYPPDQSISSRDDGVIPLCLCRFISPRHRGSHCKILARLAKDWETPSIATVKLRTRVTKGVGSVKMAEVMAFKLMIEAQKKWHKIRGHEKISTLLRGGVYKDGELIQSPEELQQEVA